MKKARSVIIRRSSFDERTSLILGSLGLHEDSRFLVSTGGGMSAAVVLVVVLVLAVAAAAVTVEPIVSESWGSKSKCSYSQLDHRHQHHQVLLRTSRRWRCWSS